MDKPFLVVDAHQDLAWNMLTFNRDYSRTVAETRQLEADTPIPNYNGDTLIGWDAYQRGRVGIVFATLFAAPLRWQEGDWDILCYRDGGEAHQMYRRQLDVYHRLVEDHPQNFTMIISKPDLEAHLAKWVMAEEGDEPPVGLVILMEGADGVRAVNELAEWWALGVRIIGPAWAQTRFCGGTGEPGPLTNEGFQLLEGMADLGFTLDISHMDEAAVLPALDSYPGRIVATHANVQALLEDDGSNRFLSQRALHGLLARDGIVGVVPYNRFLNRAWVKGMRRELTSLDNLVAHIDHICQTAGDAQHAALGSDADGGFGVQAVPPEIDSIADLQKVAGLLAARGYSQDDIRAVMGGNWLKLLEGTLPEKT